MPSFEVISPLIFDFIEGERMRNHIGKHIIEDQISSTPTIKKSILNQF